MRRILALYSEDFLLHDPDPYDHPENPARLHAALEGLEQLKEAITLQEPPSGDPHVYARVHDENYLSRVIKAAKRGEITWLDPDTYISPGTLKAVERLAGAALLAVNIATRGEGPVLILGRPPGHHAGRSGTGLGAPTLGFCLLNTSALVATLLLVYGRVAVIDFDNHHGNGTQDILWREPAAHVDVHQDPSTIYPGTGFPWQIGESPGHPKANICVPPGSGDDIAADALATAAGLLDEYKPDYLVVSAGFDAYLGDSSFTSLRLTSKSFHLAGSELSKYRERMVIVLEGGYSWGLRKGLPAFLAGILGLDDPVNDKPTASSGEAWRWYGRRKEELVRALRAGRGGAY